jgi:hypothetical protein
MIVDWTRDEEAKYQAGLVAKEVDTFRLASSLDMANKTKESLINSPPRSRSSSSKGSKKASSSLEKQNKKKEAEKGNASYRV